LFDRNPYIYYLDAKLSHKIGFQSNSVHFYNSALKFSDLLRVIWTFLVLLPKTIINLSSLIVIEALYSSPKQFTQNAVIPVLKVIF